MNSKLVLLWQWARGYFGEGIDAYQVHPTIGTTTICCWLILIVELQEITNEETRYMDSRKLGKNPFQWGGYVDSHHQYFKPLKEESPCITTRTDSSSQVYLVIAKPL